MSEIDRLKDSMSLSRNKRVKKLETENTKLRHALQTQLQDGQKLREISRQEIGRLESKLA
jgi:hypothetical protein